MSRGRAKPRVSDARATARTLRAVLRLEDAHARRVRVLLELIDRLQAQADAAERRARKR